MFRLILFFVIIVIWVIANVIKSRRSSAAASDGNGRMGEKPGRKPSAGKKYSWTWMQTAGALHLKFIRPEQANGYPAINGVIDGIGIEVQCIPCSGRTAQDCVEFRFHFPESAGIGLDLDAAENAVDLPPKNDSDQTGTRLLMELLKKRPSGAFSMRIADPEIFRCCMSSEGIEHLARLSLIYSKIHLTDTELLIRTAGINNDPLQFRKQLETLLQIAVFFAGFASHAAERKKMTVTIPPDLAEAEKELRTVPKKAAAKPVSQNAPAPAKPIETGQPEVKVGTPENLPQDQSAFLRLLWQSGNSFSRQKELFAPYADREVEWKGVLKSYYPYTMDLVFGKDGGVKASFELEEFKPEGGFMPIRIKGTAAFPKSELAKLEKNSGKIFRFRGKLLKIEPIAREIYLSCGEITGASS